MREVLLYHPDDKLAEYCLTDKGRRDVLLNLEIFRQAFEINQTTINMYNKEVQVK